jgi:DNA-binding response OmpR family regulator
VVTRILIVDDEPPIIDVLAYNLRQAHYEVLIARDGEQALALARRESPDLIILDLLLPVIDGLEVFRVLRRECSTPVIMLTARDAEIDRVVGLEMGADDYVVKPFSVRELMARVRNVLRRAADSSQAGAEGVLRTGQLVVAPARREVHIDEVAVELTSLEFDVLHYLVRHHGLVISREQLLEDVWGYDYHGDLRAVDAVIKRVRAKLREAAPEMAPIQTVRGVGYKLVEDAS